VHIIARKTLKDFWEGHPDAEQPLRAWFSEAEHALWGHPKDIKERYSAASVLTNNRVVFNIKGNKYRLVVHVRYDIGRVYVRFVGTHAEYDKIDAATI
jgi:mRNA interferase HigB